MYLLSMKFRIPGFAVKRLFTDTVGGVNYNKIQAYYDEKEIAFIRDFPGLKWKIWSVSEDGKTGYGYYLFEDKESALLRKRFAEKLYWRKGMLFVRCRLSRVLEDISIATKAQIDSEANPPASSDLAKKIMKQPLENPFKKMKRKTEQLKGIR